MADEDDQDNETWLLAAGEGIIRKKTALGHAALSQLEQLTYCLWVADYGMRNAGSLEAARDLHSLFLDEGRSAAQRLGLPCATSAFSLPSDDLERQYFSLFEEVATEVRTS